MGRVAKSSRGSGKRWLAMSALAAGACAMGQAQAGATIKIDDEKSVSVGFGLRENYTSAEDGAPGGGKRSSDFDLESGRLYFGATLNKNIQGMFSTEWDGDKIRVLDAAGQFSISPELNIWAGRLLSPSDRANMAGPYFSMGGGYWAGVASRYGFNGGIFRGRDDGVVVWGKVAGGKLGYSFGAFEGHTLGIGTLTESQANAAGVKADDALMYAGRVQYDFWDAEPGYYGTGNYLGNADILSIGVAGRYQKDGVLTVARTGKYSSYNVDFLMEKRIRGSGAVAIEAAFYDYDTDNIVLAEQGKAYSAGASYIFEQKVGWGKLQPFARWQKFNADTSIDTRQVDAGVNYIIDGYNAQVSAVYSKTKITNAGDADKVVVSLQLQY